MENEIAIRRAIRVACRNFRLDPIADEETRDEGLADNAHPRRRGHIAGLGAR